MDDTRTLARQRQESRAKQLHFDVSTGLTRILGRELITVDEVAIFEMVKNSFDAGADQVNLFFGEDSIIVADNGSGMTYDDIQGKWLFVAYSSKREEEPPKDFRDAVAERGRYAGSKGIGRFSSDRLGRQIILQTRPEGARSTIHKLVIDWHRFEENDKEHFDDIPVTYTEENAFELPQELQAYGRSLKHGTVIEVRDLRDSWNRVRLLSLKSSLAKLINPFGDETDRFKINIIAPAFKADDELAEDAAASGNAVYPKDIVNGRVSNFIFLELKKRTTFIQISTENDRLITTLTDRGELIYKISEPNPYPFLKDLASVARYII